MGVVARHSNCNTSQGCYWPGITTGVMWHGQQASEPSGLSSVNQLGLKLIGRWPSPRHCWKTLVRWCCFLMYLAVIVCFVSLSIWVWFSNLAKVNTVCLQVACDVITHVVHIVFTWTNHRLQDTCLVACMLIWLGWSYYVSCTVRVRHINFGDRLIGSCQLVLVYHSCDHHAPINYRRKGVVHCSLLNNPVVQLYRIFW